MSAAATTEGAYCEVARDWDGKPPNCGEPAIGTVIMACVHEHVYRGRICASDAVEIQRAGPREFRCEICWESSSPHDCDAVLTIEWDAP
jgi:hypothetical protein